MIFLLRRSRPGNESHPTTQNNEPERFLEKGVGEQPFGSVMGRALQIWRLEIWHFFCFFRCSIHQTQVRHGKLSTGYEIFYRALLLENQTTSDKIWCGTPP